MFARLKNRTQFLAVARTGMKFVARTFVLQIKPAGGDVNSAPRIGFTVSKKVGNAVQRNRVKRRLRALASEHLVGQLPPGDYVLIGRQYGHDAKFDEFIADGMKAISWINKKQITPE